MTNMKFESCYGIDDEPTGGIRPQIGPKMTQAEYRRSMQKWSDAGLAREYMSDPTVYAFVITRECTMEAMVELVKALCSDKRELLEATE